MIRCKSIIYQLTEMVENEISKKVYNDIMDHMEHCENCSRLYNTFIKTIDLCHHMKKIKLPVRKKKIFHKWVHMEAKKIVIKRYRY